MTALNPVYTVGFQIAEMLRSHQAMAPEGGPAPGHRAARAGRDPRARAARRRLPAPAVGRPAPAGDDRPGAGARPEAADRRRADDGARRHGAGRDPQADARPARPHRRRHPADHPRHGRRRRPVRPGARDAAGPDRRVRHVDPGLPRAAATRTPRSCCRRCPHLGAVVSDSRWPNGDGDADERRRRRPTPHRRARRRPARRRHRVPEAGSGAGVPRRRRCQPDGRSRRGRRPGRGVRVGQDDDRAGHRRAAAVRRGHGSVLGTDMVGISKEDLRKVRRDVSFVFQDPGSSLNPRLPVGESIGEPLLLQKIAKGAALEQAGRGPARPGPPGPRPAQPLPARAVGRSAPAGRHRPGAGARAAAADRRRADVGARRVGAGRVLDLFQELQREIGFACLFISHDLAVVEILSQRIAVMQNGKLVEVGHQRQILARSAGALHPASAGRRAGARIPTSSASGAPSGMPCWPHPRTRSRRRRSRCGTG